MDKMSKSDTKEIVITTPIQTFISGPLVYTYIQTHTYIKNIYLHIRV